MKRLGKAGVFLLGILFLLSLANSALAQNSNSGEINGRVTDPSGAVLPGVAVTLTNVQTGVVTTSKTNASGSYDFPSIQPGSYTLSFSNKGFREFVRKGIVLDVTTIAIDATLQVGVQTETMTVTAAAPQLQTESSDQESKRPDLPTGLTSVMRTTMSSWLMEWKWGLVAVLASSERCLRSGGLRS